MTPERMRQIEELFYAVYERSSDERDTFLAKACAGDLSLRREVEQLLVANEQAADFLSVPACQLAAPLLTNKSDESLLGQRIDHYQIISLLGKGGMGEVYRARDSKLDRMVALKILPAELATDTERMRRFVREARAASALNHPNVAHIYEIGEASTEAGGTSFIAMEYIEGQSLAAKIKDHPLETGEIIEIGCQIADALDEAHSKGITHRDIKPANLMLNERGQVKVLDFGLAKIVRQESPVSEISTLLKTEPGLVMGTVPYMSPEQALGHEVDHRTDLFSLGVVLYEMTAGRLPFSGSTRSEILDQILHALPEALARFNHNVPAELERIVAKALEKDREVRYQSAKELLVDLRRLKRDLDSARTVVASTPPITEQLPKRSLWGTALVATGIILVAGLLGWLRMEPQPPKILNSTQLTRDGRGKGPLANDGPRLYFSQQVGVSQGVLAQVSSIGGEPSVFPAPFENAEILDISPSRTELLIKNSTKIGEAESPIWVLPVLGNSPRRLGDVLAHAAAWSPDGERIVYANGSELYLVKSDGSESRKLVTVAARPFRFSWAPDGRRLRFDLMDPKTKLYSLWEVAADGTNPHPLLPGWNKPAMFGKWSPDGRYFVFLSDRDLWALREKPGFFQAASPKPMQLTFGPLDFCCPAWSLDGRKLFVTGTQRRGELVRYDAKTKHFVSYLSGMSAELLSFSKDGQWIAYVTYPEGHLWRSKVDGSERLQLSFSPLQAQQSRWSPDGKKLAFPARAPGGNWQLYLVSAEGGSAQLLVPEGKVDPQQFDPDWSPGGETLVFGARRPGTADRVIFLLDLRSRQVSTLPGSEGKFSPRWSPDGRYIAATSVDIRKLFLYDMTTQNWAEMGELSPNYPQWSHDGKYIYFGTMGHGDPALFRLRIEDRKVEQRASLKDIRRTGGIGTGWWMGLTPDDSPLILRDIGSVDIYALDWEAP